MKTLEELNTERNRINEQIVAAERAGRIAKNTPLIGKAFKYNNSYGSGESWWLYALIVRLDDNGWPICLIFQATSDSRHECWTENRYSLDSYAEEISMDEYIRARDEFLGSVAETLVTK